MVAAHCVCIISMKLYGAKNHKKVFYSITLCHVVDRNGKNLSRHKNLCHVPQSKTCYQKWIDLCLLHHVLFVPSYELNWNHVCKCLTQFHLSFICFICGSGSGNPAWTFLMCCIVIPHLTQRHLNIKSGLLGIQMCSGYKWCMKSFSPRAKESHAGYMSMALCVCVHVCVHVRVFGYLHALRRAGPCNEYIAALWKINTQIFNRARESLPSHTD